MNFKSKARTIKLGLQRSCTDSYPGLAWGHTNALARSQHTHLPLPLPANHQPEQKFRVPATHQLGSDCCNNKCIFSSQNFRHYLMIIFFQSFLQVISAKFGLILFFWCWIEHWNLFKNKYLGRFKILDILTFWARFQDVR